MTVSMHIMHAGGGVAYLLKSVVVGDGMRDLATPLTRYYNEAGTPPGHWHGTGIAAFGLVDGEQVSEQQLQLLIGHGLNPITGDPLGQTFPKFASRTERIEARVAKIELPDGSRAQVRQYRQTITEIEAEETKRRNNGAVAGYDYTFSVPKSVSVLWGLADAGTQQIIANAHHEAVARVLAFVEAEVACTRIEQHKITRQEPVLGVATAWYDHYDSRSGDPQLHSHVVISNKVQAVFDGRWRALDGRPIHQGTVAVSELYNATLADVLARDLGVAWAPVVKGRDKNPTWEIVGIDQELLTEFSSRSGDIDALAEELIANYVQAHGRRPRRDTVTKLRQQATLRTRPDKHLRSLADLTSQWRERAEPLLDAEPAAWAQGVTRTAGRSAAAVPLLRADDVPAPVLDDIAASVLAVVGDKRATWTHWHLHAEATRQTMAWRFATTTDRQTVLAAISNTAKQASLRLTPAEHTNTPARYRRLDGTSQFRPAHAVLFTSQALYQAEERLLALSRDTSGPTISATGIANAVQGIDANDGAANIVDAVMLSPDQREALSAIAASGRLVGLLVGPAGAGKTTAMTALRTAWETEHGAGSVVGLAPSATAAQVLGEDLGIATENTAKWLTDHEQRGHKFEPGQLVIVDEALLAGTFTLDKITSHAAQVGAKVLLVGDWAQLQAVAAGGAFNLLASDRPDAPELIDIHRFTNTWEKTASLHLRHGNPGVIDTYLNHGRIHDGTAETIIEAAYQSWRHDADAGLATVLIADTRATVADLNTRAREDRITAGAVNPATFVALIEGTRASVGDVVITRRNDRRLHAGSTGWVRNGDRWNVIQVHDDGAVTLRRHGYQRGAAVVLPADYVAEHLDLGYAVTAHRAQGITVDTAHAVVTAATARENLYVAMTRGRAANMAYVITEQVPRETDRLQPEAPRTAREVIAAVLTTSGAELSAHQVEVAEHEQWGSLRQLIGEYRTIRDAAEPSLEAKIDLARQRARGATGHKPSSVIVGLVSKPQWPIAPEYAAALKELETKIEHRAAQVLQTARTAGKPWTREIAKHRPARQLAVAAYRDLYQITSDRPLGPEPIDPTQRADHARIQAVITPALPPVTALGETSLMSHTRERGLLLSR